MSFPFARSTFRVSLPSLSSSARMPLRAKINSSVPAISRMVSTTAEIPKELPGDETDDVLFSSLYGVRSIELNRPKKLNSLNGSMVRKIVPRLKEWEKSQLANVIMISGAGTKAFCAGGDVAELASQNKQGEEGQKKSKAFFGQEYQLNHLIATYSKPYIAILDGITMGGGVGLSVHAPFRIATERTLFAMPETTIGFFPDVGGSFFLPRLDGEIGTYLALTSDRLAGVQTFYAGVATHYMHSSVLASLTSRLSELVFKDYDSLQTRLELVNSTIAEFTISLPTLKEEPMLLAGSLRRSIDRCFSASTVEGILDALKNEKEHPEWAAKTLKTIESRSPIALKVTLRQLRVGKTWSIAETFQREHQIAGHFMAHPDFVEGVSARLINKPPTTPKWNAPLDQITEADVDEFFRIPSNETRLPLFNDAKYMEYPYTKLALPKESYIKEFVENNGEMTVAEIAQAVSTEWNEKLGVEVKVREVLERNTRESSKGLVWIG